jgi:hypothetical protein
MDSPLPHRLRRSIPVELSQDQQNFRHNNLSEMVEKTSHNPPFKFLLGKNEPFPNPTPPA